MVIHTTGKNAVRDAIEADKDQGQLGTDGTAETENDTGLKAAVAATLANLTATKTDKSLSFDYSLDSLTGNDNTYKEYENKLSGGSLNRVTFADLEKTSAEEIQISTIIFIK